MDMADRLSDILAIKNKEPAIWCEACGHFHIFYVNSFSPGGKLWIWNEKPESPSFMPSFYKKLGNSNICHFFVKNGQIEYLNDSTHHLKGKIRDLSPLPHWY